jgi:hypothetical protein
MIVHTRFGRCLALALSLVVSQLAVPVARAATPHLLDSKDVAARLLDAADSRQEKVELFQQALATPEARARATAMGLDPDALQRAVPHLSDAELADLTSRAQRVDDVAAAGHSHNDGIVLIGIVLLLAGAAVLALAAYDDYYWDEYDDDWCYCY